MHLEDQSAVVTGGGRGIGQTICVELAERGADVAIADIDEEGMQETKELVEAQGRTASTYYTDLRDPDNVTETVERVLDDFDRIDILVNNSGIAGPTLPCEEIDVEQWDNTMQINLRGQFLMCSEVVPAMKEQEYGRIVNIASITGKRPLYNRTPYAAAKMGVIGLTRTLAEEVGEFDVNVNAICPGSVMGPRLDDVFERQAEAKNVSYDEIKADAESDSPRKELVRPEDIANAAAFLCSEDAERITGQDLNVSAGMVMY